MQIFYVEVDAFIIHVLGMQPKKTKLYNAVNAHAFNVFLPMQFMQIALDAIPSA